MANTIGTAYIQIEPTTSGLSGSISNILDGEATQAGEKAGGKLSSALGSAAKIGVGAIAGLTTAIAGAGTALTSAASSTAQYGDNIDKMSQKLGVSASFYQEWDAVLQHSGTSMDSMSATFKKLATASQDASDDQVEAFKRLGLSMDDVSKMSSEELFKSVITGLQSMEEGTERTALATQLLGKGAIEMGALLNTSAEDTQAMIDNVNKLGGVMSDDAVKASAQFQDSLQDMQTAFAGVKNSALSELLPSFTSIMDGLSNLVTGVDGGSDKIKEGVKGIVSSISNSLPTILDGLSSMLGAIMEVAPELISTLGSSIINAIPQLLPSLIQLVSSIGSMILDNLNLLVQTGLQIILELANSIASSLPSLIPTIVDVVIQIVETLVDNADMLVDGAIALIVGLTEGIINALPTLIEKAPEIVVKLCDAIIRNAPKLLKAALELIITLGKGLIDNLPKLLESAGKIIVSLVNKFMELKDELKNVGKNIIEGLKQGIAEKWDSLKNWLSDKFTALVDGVCDLLRIGSPSKVFRDEVGRWIPEGVAVGIEANTDSVTEAMDNMALETLNAGNRVAQTAYSVSADYESTRTDDSSTVNAIFNLLQSYMPNMATNDRLNNLNFSVNNREFARLVNGVV